MDANLLNLQGIITKLANLQPKLQDVRNGLQQVVSVLKARREGQLTAEQALELIEDLVNKALPIMDFILK
jgi:hypothetical protein